MFVSVMQRLRTPAQAKESGKSPVIAEIFFFKLVIHIVQSI